MDAHPPLYKLWVYLITWKQLTIGLDKRKTTVIYSWRMENRRGIFLTETLASGGVGTVAGIVTSEVSNYVGTAESAIFGAVAGFVIYGVIRSIQYFSGRKLQYWQ